ncbi:MAG: N-glycosylase/DNA lyase [Candidatus Nanoarchaeia archaeon]|nr:N-glycosylase/DNA lyase [Candidatus Nanoarchaeia archaeon]
MVIIINKNLIENKLIEKIKNTYNNIEIRNKINKRYDDFQYFQKKDVTNNEIFIELCFCLLTANYNAKKAIEIQEKIGNGFILLTQEELSLKLKELGYRYPNKRSEYIVEARKYKDNIKDIIFDNKLNKEEKREFLVKNIKGLGFKESSHLLRNIGFKDYSIIDFHIVDILVENNIINKPNSKTIKKDDYLKIEKKLEELLSYLPKEIEMDLNRLDIYLWYIETSTIFK